MKTISKSFVAFALILLASPLATFAAPKDIIAGKAQGEAKFCENIDAITSKISSDLIDKGGKFDGKKSDRLAKISERRTHRDETRVDNRAERDVKHDTRIDALMAKADTDAERAAVNTFEATLNSAVNTRRNSVDAAVKTFRTGVDNLVNGKFAALDAAVAAFKSSVESAITTAKADCAANKDPKTVRTTFMASIKSARDAFKDARPELIKTEIQTLANARKASIDAAITTFKSTMQNAMETLKTAFGGEIE
jgi:hypothetical protein